MFPSVFIFFFFLAEEQMNKRQKKEKKERNFTIIKCLEIIDARFLERNAY